jgi:DNA-binding transcriptional MerR regulator
MNAPAATAMYSIKAVSHATGLSIETLRAWERRYGIVEPTRDGNGRRAYRPEDVIRLRKLREATERGHPISRLARLGSADLERLLGQPAPRQGGSAPLANIAAQVIEAAADYRPADCDRLLATALALLPLSQVVHDILTPLMREVGERWHRGELSIAQERMISMALRKQLSSVLDTYGRIATGPVMVFATPSGERHELGILMGALLASARNARCHYLGPDIPVADLATYATRVQARVLVLSVLMQESSLPQLHELAQFLPEAIDLWAGGGALERAGREALPARLRLLPDLASFDQEVALLVSR